MNEEMENQMEVFDRLLEDGHYKAAERRLRAKLLRLKAGNPVMRAMLLVLMGQVFCSQNRLAQGRRVFGQAADLLKPIYLPEDEALQALLARAAEAARQNPRVGPTFVTDLVERIYGRGWLAAQALHRLGQDVAYEKHRAEAAGFYRVALGLMQEVVGPRHVGLRELLEDMTSLSQKQKDWAGMITAAKTRLEILEPLPLNDNEAPEDDCYWDLAEAQRSAGDPLSALTTMAEFRRNLYHDGHDSFDEKVANVQLYQARLHADLGHVGQALALGHKALVYMQEYAPDAHLTGDCLDLLGQLHLRRGRARGDKKDFQQAYDLLREAATYYYSANDGGAREQIEGARNLGEVCRRLKKFKEATEHCRLVLDICIQKFGPESEQAANAIGDLAVVAIERKRYAEARQLLKKGIGILQKIESQPPRVALLAQLQNLAYVEARERLFPAAIRAGQRLLTVAANDLSVDDPPMAPYLHNQAGFLALAGRTAEAETLYARAIRVYEQDELASHAGLKMAAQELRHLKAGQFRKTLKSFIYSGPVHTWVLGRVDEEEEDQDDET